MLNEIFKEMIIYYERNKERESKLIGKKKSTTQVNNFLFIPTEAYLEMIKGTYNLKEDNLKPLKKIVDRAVKKMEQQIKELTLEIPISQDSEIDFDFIEVIKAFYTNKLLSNLLSTILRANDNLDIWIDDWIWDEFTMPFFLCNILTSERGKSVGYFTELKRELDKHKKHMKKESVRRKNKVGRPGKFKTEEDLHKKISTIPNWKSLNKTAKAKALGYSSSSGLNELLKDNNWSLPL